MEQLNTFNRIQRLLKEKEKYIKSLQNLDLLKEKGEITLRQYEELAKDYSRKLQGIDEGLDTLKKGLKEEIAKLRDAKEQLDEQIRKTEIGALIGEIPPQKAKNQIARLKRKIDSIDKKIHLYESAVHSNLYSEFQAKLEQKAHKSAGKSIKTLKSLKEILEEKEKQDNNLKNLEELYKKEEVNKKEYETLKREYLLKLEEIIDQIESIRREIELYIGEIKVEKEHLENAIEEVEVRIKVGEIDEKEGKDTIEQNIKQIKKLDQHIFKLMKIMRANSPSQLEKIIEEEKGEGKEQKTEVKYPPRKKRFKVSYATFGILIIILIGYLLKDHLPLLNTESKIIAENTLSFKPYLMYLENSQHIIDTIPISPYEYVISTIKSTGERLMLPLSIKDKLLFLDEKGHLYLSTQKLDSITLIDSINSFVDCDPVYIGPYVIFSDLDGNVFVFNSNNLKLKNRIRVEGPITAQPVSENGILYIFTETGNLYSYNVAKDSILWNVKLENGGRATPIISGKYLYVLNAKGTLYKFDKERGIKEKEVNLDEPCESSPIAYKGKIFIGTLKGSLYAITMDSLKTFYKININSPIKTSPAASKGAVIVGDLGGTCYAYSTLDTTLLWMYNTKGPNILGISIYDSVVLVANTEKIIALNLYTTGTVAETLWERKIQNGVVAKPPFVYKGNIYLLTADGKIILLTAKKDLS